MRRYSHVCLSKGTAEKRVTQRRLGDVLYGDGNALSAWVSLVSIGPEELGCVLLR